MHGPFKLKETVTEKGGNIPILLGKRNVSKFFGFDHHLDLFRLQKLKYQEIIGLGLVQTKPLVPSRYLMSIIIINTNYKI